MYTYVCLCVCVRRRVVTMYLCIVQSATHGDEEAQGLVSAYRGLFVSECECMLVCKCLLMRCMEGLRPDKN